MPLSKNNPPFLKTTRQRERLQGRLDTLWAYDAALRDASNMILIGVDEVGRGSLIGPVVAAATTFQTKDVAACFNSIPSSVLPEALLGLDDSKASHLNHPWREALAQEIRALSVSTVAEATQQEVEQLNVNQASLLAAKRAVADCLTQLKPSNETPILVVMDGRHTISGLEALDPSLSQQAIIKGDGKSASIAAASIIAKTYRDNWVLQLTQKHPEWDAYGWASNMGYATASHRATIEKQGLTPYHRSTFTLKQNQGNLFEQAI